MLSEEFISCVAGPPITATTAVSKDVGVYVHSLRPSVAVRTTFKKSSATLGGLAFNETHIFTAQQDKAHVHVYSRLRNNMETLVPFAERIRCLAILDDILLLGGAEGRLMSWEICTGRQVTTPACHVQAVTCMAVTPHFVLTGSEDSNIHVWSLLRLLAMDPVGELEPARTLSNHRGAITSIVAGGGSNPETSLCVSASRDKTCVIWNYQKGEALRTLLFTSPPISLAMDPCGRAVFVGSEDSSIYLVELFGEKPLVGAASESLTETAVQIKDPFGVCDSDAGPPTCLDVSYDGSILLSGHAKGKVMRWSLASSAQATEVVDLNAAVTNLAFVPLFWKTRHTRALTVVKPSQAGRSYTFKAQLTTNLDEPSDAGRLLDTMGYSEDMMRQMLAGGRPEGAPPVAGEGDAELRRQIDDLWGVIEEQRELQKLTYQKYLEAKGSRQ